MLTQTLQSMRVVKAYGQEENEARRFRRIVGNIRKYLMRTTRTRAAVGPVSEVMTGLGIAAAILYGGWQGIYGNVSLGHFMGFMTAAMLAFQPMQGARGHPGDAERGPARRGARLRAARLHVARDREARAPSRSHVTAGAISFRDVHFAYDSGGPMLSGFNLEVAPGQKVALVGPSGAGKSTVFNLVLALLRSGRAARS